MSPARQTRPNRPPETRDLRSRDANQERAAMPELQFRPYEQDNSSKAENQPEDPAGRERLPAEADELDARHPEWDAGNEHGRQAAGYCLFGPYDAAVPEAHHEHAQDGERRPVAAGAKPFAARHPHDQQQNASRQPSKRCHQDRRHRLERDADREVRRSPDEAYDDPGDVRTTQRWWGHDQALGYGLKDLG